ncbi:MAG: sugar phosphate isomerase/epimerase [Deltaproteobacteria bacterium]|nr:sugar phosphate isomerase/epimerase [Deltaproteobacteria bacterium]
MLLGLHTYSFHLHGMGQNWGGYKMEWPQVWDIFGLMAEAKKLGLDGLHLTATDLGRTDDAHLSAVKKAAEEYGLYLEYNFSLNSADYDPRLTNTIEEGIDIASRIGSDIGKISMDIHRPKPVCGSMFHPRVIEQLEEVANKVSAAAPKAARAGVRLCLENHTEAFADEVIWVINKVNHPFVGACVDTNNSLMVGEDPLFAIRKLAPLAFTNHFSDHRIEFEPYGCRITGVACGEGDVPMKKAYEIIKANPWMKRLNLEVEFDPRTDDILEARRREYEAVVKSIHFARNDLGVGK